VQRYSEEFDAALATHYAIDTRARSFFIVHGKVDQEHTAMAADTIARNANTDREKEMVRVAAKNMVRFKLAKFDGIYDAYASLGVLYLEFRVSCFRINCRTMTS